MGKSKEQKKREKVLNNYSIFRFIGSIELTYKSEITFFLLTDEIVTDQESQVLLAKTARYWVSGDPHGDKANLVFKKFENLKAACESMKFQDAVKTILSIFNREDALEIIIRPIPSQISIIDASYLKRRLEKTRWLKGG